ncbi:MAG: hypothetical protein QNI84_16500 [Henriciella sp.]|nr:hypothetical protein [Henriciella sp.]
MLPVRLFSISALISLAAACATGPLTYDDDLIVPGERVGEVEIGMPLDQLLALKGAPLRTAPIQGTAATTYQFDGLAVAADDEVYWIVVLDPRFRTADGISTGAEQIAARASFGRPDCVVSAPDTTLYDYGNVYFDVDNTTGKVRRLGVMDKTYHCQD